MKTMKRAIRRHHSERLKAKTRKLLLISWGDVVKEDKILLDHKIRRWYNNYSICSCEMCRNPRRSGWGQKKTIPELNNEIKFKEEINAYQKTKNS